MAATYSMRACDTVLTIKLMADVIDGFLPLIFAMPPVGPPSSHIIVIAYRH